MKKMENRLSSLIGKRINGVRSSNFDGSSASEITLYFEGGSKITFLDTYEECCGWAKFQVSFDDDTKENP